MLLFALKESQPHLSLKTKSHDQLAVDLDIIDFERATKVTGSRFAIFKGLGARLERAVAAYMLDTHVPDTWL